VNEERPDDGLKKRIVGGVFLGLGALFGALGAYTGSTLLPLVFKPGACSSGFVGEGVLLCGFVFVIGVVPIVAAVAFFAAGTALEIVGVIRGNRFAASEGAASSSGG
jgi:hypothetical protein